MSGSGKRKPGDVWLDLRCLEEHLRVFEQIVCAIASEVEQDEFETTVSDEDRDRAESSLEKGSLHGKGASDGPADGGVPCIPGYPCDGGQSEFSDYLGGLNEFCKLIFADLTAIIGTLDERTRIKVCAGMLCTRSLPGRDRG